jgi:hypothetical protein
LHNSSQRQTSAQNTPNSQLKKPSASACSAGSAVTTQAWIDAAGEARDACTKASGCSRVRLSAQFSMQTAAPTGGTYRFEAVASSAVASLPIIVQPYSAPLKA